MKVQLSQKQKAIHDRAVFLKVSHSELEASRVENLIEVEAFGVHTAFRKKMFIYATEILEMDPELAYPYISVARACVRFPSMLKALREGKLSVSKAGRIVSSLKQENAEELIQFAQIHSKREVEEEVARRNPKAGSRDRIRPLSAEYDELKARLTKECSKNLKRAMALNPSFDLGQTLNEIIAFYLDHKDPVRKAERAAKRPTETRPAPKFCPGRKRVRLTSKEKHAVNLRDKGRCTFVGPDGKRCESEHWTEAHHIIQVIHGGTNVPENLTTLCSFHHDLVHQLSLPIDGLVEWTCLR